MSTTTRSTCPDPELLSALVDAELDAATRAEVTAHLATCADCAALVASERRIKVALGGLGDPALPSDLAARLLAIPSSEGQVVAPVREIKRRRLPAYLAAAASVVVLMVGAFTFIGATGSSQNSPNRTTAIVPSADRLSEEHAVTSVQYGLGGPGIAAVPVSLPTAAAP